MTPFHTVIQGALVAGVSGILLSPNATLSPRALVEADGWAHFRIRRFRFRILPNDTITAALAVGYVGGVQDASPGTLLQVSELLPSAVRGIQQTVPSRWVAPTRSELSGPLPWYKTIPGTADATEEAPGALALTGSTTSPFTIEVEGAFEFKTSVASGNTPRMLELYSQIRDERASQVKAAERGRLLSILSPAPPTQPTPCRVEVYPR